MNMPEVDTYGTVQPHTLIRYYLIVVAVQFSDLSFQQNCSASQLIKNSKNKLLLKNYKYPL